MSLQSSKTKKIICLFLLFMLLGTGIFLAWKHKKVSEKENIRPNDNFTSANLDDPKLYYLRVFIDKQVVTAFSSDNEGNYTEVEKNMLCSTGLAETPTPLGSFNAGFKNRWELLYGPCYGQYITQIDGPYYFHSIPYEKEDPTTLMDAEFFKIGQKSSHGCVRLLVKDAKWIYENCPTGTVVEVLESSTDFEGIKKPEAPTQITAGIDPTDEAANQFEPASPKDPSNKSYIVQTGDTLFKIAALNDPANPNSTVADLIALNHLEDEIIYVGQELILP